VRRVATGPTRHGTRERPLSRPPRVHRTGGWGETKNQKPAGCKMSGIPPAPVLCLLARRPSLRASASPQHGSTQLSRKARERRSSRRGMPAWTLNSGNSDASEKPDSGVPGYGGTNLREMLRHLPFFVGASGFRVGSSLPGQDLGLRRVFLPSPRSVSASPASHSPESGKNKRSTAVYRSSFFGCSPGSGPIGPRASRFPECFPPGPARRPSCASGARWRAWPGEW